MNYTLKLTEKQCRVVQAALDLYYRIGMGQLQEVVHVAVEAPNHYWRKGDGWRRVTDAVNALKKEFLGWPNSGMNYGITSPKLPDAFRVACDIHDVIRQRLAFDGLKPGGKPGFGVAFDPVRQKGKEPLATIKKRPSRSGR